MSSTDAKSGTSEATATEVQAVRNSEARSVKAPGGRGERPSELHRR